MTLRRPLLLATAAALVLSGCGTFTDNDVVASVDDVELTEQQLRDYVTGGEQADDDGPVTVTRNEAEQVVRLWIIEQVLRKELDRLDIETPPASDTLFAELDAVTQAWLPVAADVTTEQSTEIYAQADATGFICLAVAAAESEDVAQQVFERANDDDLSVTEAAVGFGGAVDSGDVPCGEFEQIAAIVEPNALAATFDAGVGEPVGPVQIQGNWFVVELREFDELSDDEVAAFSSRPTVLFSPLIEQHDISVDPRYGEIDGFRLVAPVG